MEIKMSCEETIVKKYYVSFTAEDVEDFKQFLGSYYVYKLVLKNEGLTVIKQDIKDLTFEDIVTAFEEDDMEWSNQYRTVRFKILVKEFLQFKFYKLYPHDSSNIIKQQICYGVEE